MKFLQVAIVTAVSFLISCGVSTPRANSPTSNPTPPSNNTPVNANITGNWQLTATSSETAYAGESGNYGVYLTQTGNTVSGIAWSEDAYPLCVLPSELPCAFPFGVINPYLVGTIDVDGNIVLNSPSSSNGGAFSITGDTTNGTTINSIYTITLVTASPAGTFIDHGTVSGVMMDILNGTYIGTVKTVSGYTLDVSATLSQTPSPNSNGFLIVSGSASLTGSSCIGSVTMPVSGTLFGNDIVVGFTPNNSPTTNITLGGTLSQDTRTIVATYFTNGGCGNDSGSGTLTRQ